MLTSLRIVRQQFFGVCRGYASKPNKKGGKAVKDDGAEKINIAAETAALLSKSSLAFKSVLERTRTEFGNVRIGRAHAGLLDTIFVSHNNSRLPLKDISHISAKDASTLKVVVHEEQLMRIAEKAVRDASLGLNPQRESPTAFLVPIPRLSKEYRETILKAVAQIAEKAKARIREIRTETKGDVKKKLKNAATGDELRAFETKLQTETNSAITEIDNTLESKKKEITQ
ncbi:ribosome recycling factor domain-containing protein [Chytridium lagenaria]|nr:ribosome recycling factor domain-containing protein [Chytridium lagenaria]